MNLDRTGIDLSILRRLALAERARARERGPAGRTRVRSAGALGQPYDVLELDFFAAEPLSAQPGSGETAFAYSPELVFDPPYGFAPYTLLWAEPQPLELDDAALGGLFRAYFELRFDDERVENLNVFEVYAPGDGSVAAIPPFIDSAQEAGEGRRLVGARLALSADGPGTATATLYPGVSWLLFFRSREGQYRHEELTIDD